MDVDEAPLERAAPEGSPGTRSPQPAQHRRTGEASLSSMITLRVMPHSHLSM